MCFASSRQTQTAMESPYQIDGDDRDLAGRDVQISTKPHLDIEGKVFQMFDLKLEIKSVKGFIKCSEFMMFSSIRNIRK